MNSPREPGFYNPVERHNAHRAWRPEGERVWDDSLRSAGDRLIDAYPLVSQGDPPAFLEGIKLSPGELVEGIVSEQAYGENFWEFLDDMGVEMPTDSHDWGRYWENLTNSFRNHSNLDTVAIDALHKAWNERCDAANDTPSAVAYKEKAREWGQGFEYGVRKLIDKGRLPLTQAELTTRLEHPAEIAYIPDYALRLDFMRRGESGADVPFGAFSDHNRGILYVKGIDDDDDSTRSRFMHENIHFYLDGVLSVDTTLTTGETIPYDCYIGMWEVAPQLDPRLAEIGDAFGRKIISRHLELNEGATELINADIHAEVPELGQFATRGKYAGWLSVWKALENEGMDLTPFLGYKVTDQTLDRVTAARRYQWRFAMTEEFARVFDSRAYNLRTPRKAGMDWVQFDKNVARINTEISDPYDESSAGYLALLAGVSKRNKLQKLVQPRHDDIFRPRPAESWGIYRRQRADQPHLFRFDG
jgi:hypothetical protein